jgi:hypothetical protein
LGDELSTGTVIGLVQKQMDDFCELAKHEIVYPGLCYWQTNQWARAGDWYPVQTFRNPQPFYSLVVLKSASFETQEGTFVRDYVEIHSPDAENVYTEKIAHLGEMQHVTLPVH